MSTLTEKRETMLELEKRLAQEAEGYCQGVYIHKDDLNASPEYLRRYADCYDKLVPIYREMLQVLLDEAEPEDLTITGRTGGRLGKGIESFGHLIYYYPKRAAAMRDLAELKDE